MRNILFMSSAEGEPSLWSEFWKYINEKYFSVDMSSYENLGFEANSMITLPMIVIAFAIGLVIASVLAAYNKRVLGELVRQMIYQGALGKENAKTLEELGFSGRRSIAQSLRRGVTLRRVVKCSEEVDYNNEMAEKRLEYEKKREENDKLPPFKMVDYNVNTSKDHFYIPHEEKFTAETKFNKKGTTWFGVVIVAIVSIILVFVLLSVIPWLLGMLDAALGSTK